jgi:hypothetical protein
MITLISYMANRSLTFSILLAVGFVVIIALIKEQLIYEGFIEGMEDMEVEGMVGGMVEGMDDMVEGMEDMVEGMEEGMEDDEMPKKPTSEMPGMKKKPAEPKKKPATKKVTEVPAHSSPSMPSNLKNNTTAAPMKKSASPMKTSASPMKTSASPMKTSASPMKSSASPMKQVKTGTSAATNKPKPLSAPKKTVKQAAPKKTAPPKKPVVKQDEELAALKEMAAA